MAEAVEVGDSRPDAGEALCVQGTSVGEQAWQHLCCQKGRELFSDSVLEK